MLLTEKVKLVPTPEQKELLLLTMETFNTACDKLSGIAFSEKAFDIYSLHKLAYYGIRSEFKLPAQLTIRAIAKVVETYKQDKSAVHLFRKRSSLIYDSRALDIKSDGTVSLTTIQDRLRIPFKTKLANLTMSSIRNQMDIVNIRGRFYLNVVFEVPEEPEIEPQGFLGVDIGIANLAATSDGNLMSGEYSRKVRKRYKDLRGKLQRVGTKSAKKHLKKLSKKESANKAHQNHCISKTIVLAAQDTKRGIALEDLKGIRSLETASKRHREERDHWAFYQLQSFIQYKAKIAGVPVLFVDSHDTSMICSECGCCIPENRVKSQFRCKRCGHREHADTNAAKNISSRATIAWPIVVPPKEKGVWNDKPLSFRIDAGYSHSTVAGGLFVIS